MGRPATRPAWMAPPWKPPPWTPPPRPPPPPPRRANASSGTKLAATRTIVARPARTYRNMCFLLLMWGLRLARFASHVDLDARLAKQHLGQPAALSLRRLDINQWCQRSFVLHLTATKENCT